MNEIKEMEMEILDDLLRRMRNISIETQEKFPTPEILIVKLNEEFEARNISKNGVKS